MAGFRFERDLAHQQFAVNAVMGVLDDVASMPNESPFEQALLNPVLDIGLDQWVDNIMRVQARNGIDSRNMKYRDRDKRILDISMETGTGKTYTYTKTLFELNKHFGLHKFIVVVPSLSIKAGTVNFLRSEAAREHFRQDYGKDMRCHVLESKKGNRKGKTYMPPAVSQFVQAGHITQNTIDILVVNAGMLHSPTMNERFDVSIFEQLDTPISALQSVNAVTIVDEPHKFPVTGKFWQSVLALNSQLIIRYGATFNDEYTNLVYELTAVDSFNQSLVKGIVAHIEEFKEGSNTIVKLTQLDGTEATFELNKNGKKSSFKLSAKDSLSTVHPEMNSLYIERMNKSVLVLSNGLELKRGARINPYSYAQSLQHKMMQQAVKKHFELEREYLTRDVKIKPLTLFFIDDIEGYRASSHEIGGELKTEFETLVRTEINKLLKTEPDGFYRDYLERSLKDLSLVHGGYFSKDNTENDEKIVREVEEILHDKEALLSLENPRRFIFSKWTLREGWDNPNVFQICKLRSSGSQTSKLQEVGRGLRLPVNEYMGREKDEQFDLHYYVDFTEASFVDDLIGEINEKSHVFDIAVNELTDDLIDKILEHYLEYENDNALLKHLISVDIIEFNKEFKEGGFEQLKQQFPLAFQFGVGCNKIRNQNQTKAKAQLRKGHYEELKNLWETINQRVILEYKVKDEAEFESLLLAYFENNIEQFKPQGSLTRKQRLRLQNGVAYFREQQQLNEEILPISSMSYRDFLLSLSAQLSININTLHRVFLKLEKRLDINDYLSMQTVRMIKGGFDKFLLDNAFGKVTVAYQKVSNEVHPTRFTDTNGKPLADVDASYLGVHYDTQPTASQYLFDETFFDSELEKQNILQDIEEVTVFTKIPKSSIRIPVAGGSTYSPDFAYVIKTKDGKKQLHLVVETKDKEERGLSTEEDKKIEHAAVFFNAMQSNIDVKFKTQFKNEEMIKVIEQCFQ